MPARAHPGAVPEAENERRATRPARRGGPVAESGEIRLDVDGPAASRPATLHTLQSTVGNRAVARMVRRQPTVVHVSPAPAAAVQRQEEHWAKATYPSSRASMRDHFRRHPSSEWSDVQAYTDKALEVLKDNYNRATEHELADGSKGWKIRTSKYFGIYTNDDKIVTFGER